VIDDLKINPIVDKVENIYQPELKVFPNPGNGMVNIIVGNVLNLKPVMVSVYNYAGKCIIREALFNEETITLNLTGNPSGLYLIVINNGRNTSSIKYNLIK
jgi:hypothetical protein